MKKPKDHIYKLIHAMSPHEKRYFKRHYCNSSNLLTKIYDYISSNKVESDEVIKKYFKDSLVSKNLKVYKVQLKELLLKSLHSIDYKKNINNKINIGLLEVDILIKKQLYKLAWLQIQKLKKLSAQYENFEQQLALIHKEENLKASQCIYKLPSETPTDNKTEILEKLVLIAKIKTLTNKIKNPDLLNQLLKKPSLNIEELNLINALKTNGQDSFRTQFFANECLAQYYNNIEQHPERCLHYCQKNIENIQHYTHLKEAYPLMEWQADLDFINYSSWQADLRVPSQNLIGKLYTRIREQPEFDFFHFPLYHYETRIAYFNNDYESVFQNELNIINWLEKNELEEHCDAFQLYLYFSLSYLWKGDAQKTFFYLQKMFLYNKKIPIHYYALLNIIELIANFIFKDFEMLNYRVKSLSRYNSKASESPFFFSLLETFKEIAKSSPNKHEDIIHKFFLKIENFKEEPIYTIAKLFILDKWINKNNYYLGIRKLIS